MIRRSTAQLTPEARAGWDLLVEHTHADYSALNEAIGLCLAESLAAGNVPGWLDAVGQRARRIQRLRRGRS